MIDKVSDKPESDVEDYDDSMNKCKKINKIIPMVCRNIEKMKKVNETFAIDFDLQMAGQLLDSLNSMELPTTEDEKIEYVEEFREHLISGLRSLGGFFNNLTNLDKLSNEQKEKISEISASIVISQDSIKHIASS
jgi:hypothetical protein